MGRGWMLMFMFMWTEHRLSKMFPKMTIWGTTREGVLIQKTIKFIKQVLSDKQIHVLHCRYDPLIQFLSISRLWSFLSDLLRGPRWLLHQLQRRSQARGPRPLCAISQMLSSPVRRPGRGMPSVSQILPQVFRSRQNSLPELQPETSLAQWVEFGSWILWSLHVPESSSGICDLFA